MLNIFLVDDEAPARNRLRELLSDCAPDLPLKVVGEASDGMSALAQLNRLPVDVVLLDIHMPGMDGLAVAQHLAQLQQPPTVIFVTAFDSHAIAAFEVNARDYLLKPVRADRLLDALRKVSTLQHPPAQLRVVDRGQIHLIPLKDVLWLRAEQKYVTAHTLHREYWLENSLSHLEQEWPQHFMRIHRNALVAKHVIAGLRSTMPTAGESEAGMEVLIHGTEEALPVSRRLQAALRLWVNQQGL